MKRMTAAIILFALLAMLFVITVLPGSSILGLNIDVGSNLFAFYAAYMVGALLTVLLWSVFFTLWGTRQQAKAHHGGFGLLGLRRQRHLTTEIEMNRTVGQWMLP